MSKHPTALTDQEKLSLESDLGRIAETLFPEEGDKLRAAADLICMYRARERLMLSAMGVK